MRTNSHSAVSIGTAAWLALACAACASAKPPTELLLARDAYTTAKNGAAATYDPDSLLDAKLALRKAESSYAMDGDSDETRDAATIAMRRAQLAEYRADVLAGLRMREEQEKARQEELARLQTQQDEQGATDQEPTGMEASEETPRAAVFRLNAIDAAATRVEDDNIVFRLTPDDSLFESGTAAYNSELQPMLEAVASALSKQGSDTKLVVEGFADAQGPESANVELSQARADTVAGFLVERGVPPENIDAVGMGEAEPIATNATPEGRAQNRRVEVALLDVYPPRRDDQSDDADAYRERPDDFR